MDELLQGIKSLSLLVKSSVSRLSGVESELKKLNSEIAKIKNEISEIKEVP